MKKLMTVEYVSLEIINFYLKKLEGILIIPTSKSAHWFIGGIFYLNTVKFPIEIHVHEEFI